MNQNIFTSMSQKYLYDEKASAGNYFNFRNTWSLAASTEALSSHHLRSNNYQHNFTSRPGVNISAPVVNISTGARILTPGQKYLRQGANIYAGAWILLPGHKYFCRGANISAGARILPPVRKYLRWGVNITVGAQIFPPGPKYFRRGLHSWLTRRTGVQEIVGSSSTQRS